MCDEFEAHHSFICLALQNLLANGQIRVVSMLSRFLYNFPRALYQFRSVSQLRRVYLRDSIKLFFGASPYGRKMQGCQVASMLDILLRISISSSMKKDEDELPP